MEFQRQTWQILPSVSERIAAASDVEYSFCVAVAMFAYYRMRYRQSIYNSDDSEVQ